LSQFLGKVHFGYLITVCDRAERGCPVFPGVGTRLSWSFEDPAAFQGTVEQRLAKFREVRDALELSIREWLVFRGSW
jgi:arsenate reductase